MTRITTNVLRDISLFHAETAEDAEIPFAMDKCTANLCVTLRPLREIKISVYSVHSVCDFTMQSADARTVRPYSTPNTSAPLNPLPSLRENEILCKSVHFVCDFTMQSADAKYCVPTETLCAPQYPLCETLAGCNEKSGEP